MAELIDYLSASDQTHVVFLPRIAIQKSEIAKWNIQNFWIPDHVLDGPNLLHSADLVISAGGTMNRESAVLVRRHLLFLPDHLARWINI
jgi:predicted glycosyltransferase